jgi:hypothetical protein
MIPDRGDTFFQIGDFLYLVTTEEMTFPVRMTDSG